MLVCVSKLQNVISMLFLSSEYVFLIYAWSEWNESLLLCVIWKCVTNFIGSQVYMCHLSRINWKGRQNDRLKCKCPRPYQYATVNIVTWASMCDDRTLDFWVNRCNSLMLFDLFVRLTDICICVKRLSYDDVFSYKTDLLQFTTSVIHIH